MNDVVSARRRAVVRACGALLGAALGLASLGPAPVAAHAVVVASTPARGATTVGPDLEIRLRFNVRVDPVRSRLSLALPGGRLLDLDIIDGGPPDELSAEAFGLQPGPYELRWQMLSSDGHITRGSIPFVIAE